MNEMQQKVSAIGVVPVIKLTNPTRDAGPLSDALCAGGVPVAEITFRAAGADEAMRIMLERCRYRSDHRDGGQDHRRRRQVCGHSRSGC